MPAFEIETSFSLPLREILVVPSINRVLEHWMKKIVGNRISDIGTMRSDVNAFDPSLLVLSYHPANSLLMLPFCQLASVSRCVDTHGPSPWNSKRLLDVALGVEHSSFSRDCLSQLHAWRFSVGVVELSLDRGFQLANSFMAKLSCHSIKAARDMLL
jgi:hypothetical protein